MAKKEKNYGDCHVCQNPLDKYHLKKGSVRVCSYECADEHSDQKKQVEKLGQLGVISDKPKGESDG